MAWFEKNRKPLDRIEDRLKELLKMAQITQSQLDALTATVGSIDATTSTILAEVQALAAANPNLDLSGLTAAVTKLQGDIGTVQSTLAPGT